MKIIRRKRMMLRTSTMEEPKLKVALFRAETRQQHHALHQHDSSSEEQDVSPVDQSLLSG
jgi:hypothetical protein